MRQLFKELYGYGAASVAALSIDLFILWLLVRSFETNYVAAATVSFLSGAIVAYWLSIKIAFRHHRLRDRRLEFVCFVAIGTGGLVINACVISVAVQFLGLHYLLAKCVAAGFTFTFNFFARRQILFIAHSSAEISS
jgi:putative flippase GtrA